MLEWRKLKKPILLVHAASVIVMVVLTCTLYKSYALEYDLEAWEIANGYYTVLFPLLVVMPTCWLFYYERKNGFIMYTLTRTSKKKYLLAKWLVIAGNGFMLMFSTMVLGVIAALYVKPDITPVLALNDPVTGLKISQIEATHFMPELFAKEPLVYGLLLSLWRGFLGALMATMGFMLSLLSRNLFIILSGPFIYSLLENYILSIMSAAQFRLVTSFEPRAISFADVNVYSVLAGPGLVMLFIAGLYGYLAKIKKETVYPS